PAPSWPHASNPRSPWGRQSSVRPGTAWPGPPRSPTLVNTIRCAVRRGSHPCDQPLVVIGRPPRSDTVLTGAHRTCHWKGSVMGLFARAKNAFGAGASDLAAQAQAAQQLMGEEMRKAGYTDGSMPTMAGAGALQAQAQAD